MKKHHIILFILVANLIVFATFMIAWLALDMFNENNAHTLILVMSYALPPVTIAPFIIKMNSLTIKQKWNWIIYTVLIGFIGAIHFYIKYKNEISRIATETAKGMKEGPNSLSEFDSGSYR